MKRLSVAFVFVTLVIAQQEYVWERKEPRPLGGSHWLYDEHGTGERGEGSGWRHDEEKGDCYTSSVSGKTETVCSKPGG